MNLFDVAFLTKNQYDVEAVTWFETVEAAGGSFNSTDNKAAFSRFIEGCKNDPSPSPNVSNWQAIKQLIFFRGINSLTAQLIPLIGPSVTNQNFVSGDFNSALGLQGNGVDKRIILNRANNSTPQNNNHMVSWIGSPPTIATQLAGADTNASGANSLVKFSNGFGVRSRNSTILTVGTAPLATFGFIGHSRNSSSEFIGRHGGINSNVAQTSQTPSTGSLTVFANGAGIAGYGSILLSMFSSGEAIDLERYDARLTRLFGELV